VRRESLSRQTRRGRDYALEPVEEHFPAGSVQGLTEAAPWLALGVGRSWRGAGRIFAPSGSACGVV
jgi:hypothetical protein